MGIEGMATMNFKRKDRDVIIVIDEIIVVEDSMYREHTSESIPALTAAMTLFLSLSNCWISSIDFAS